MVKMMNYIVEGDKVDVSGRTEHVRVEGLIKDSVDFLGAIHKRHPELCGCEQITLQKYPMQRKGRY